MSEPPTPRAKLPTPVVGTPGGESVAVHVEEAPETPSEKRSSAQAQSAQEVETTLHTAGQRETSMMWESTQMRLAILTVGGFLVAHIAIVLVIGFVLSTQWEKTADSAVLAVLVAVLTASLGSIATLAAGVIASYFHRTNSTRVGGPGGDSAGTR